VEEARSYIVEIKGENGENKELTPRKATASLSSLEEGDYEIRIKAVGDGSEFEDSDWTEILYFHKDYETGCIYSLINNNTEYEIKKYGKAASTIYIEDVYRGKPVTRIAEKAFKGYSKIENVYIGNNVESIDDGAFQYCKNLKTVSIPESVKTIGMSAFQSCIKLENVNIPEAVTVIEDHAFSYCRSLKSIELHDKITKIGEYAFSDCSSMESVIIPDSVISFGEAAFTGNTSLTTVTLGKGITKLANEAFYMCTSLKTIHFSKEGTLVEIGDGAFSECIALENVIIPDGVEIIGDWAFCMEGEETEIEEDVYVRITVKDKFGKYADTNAYFTDELFNN
jgi:hypothetical protein